MQYEKPEKKSGKIILMLVLVLAVAAVFKFFYVDGMEIAKKLREYENAEFTIEKYESIENKVAEVKLSSTQRDALITLFAEAHFRVVLADTVYSSDLTRYDIFVNGTVGELSGTLFSIGITGGKYLSATDMFNGKFGRIYDKRWNEKLDEILTISD